MRSRPAKRLLRWLWGCCTSRTGAAGRPGFAHAEKRKLSELTAVVHNPIGTAETVRPDFSEAHSERTKKKVTRCGKGHGDWIQGKRSSQGGWLSTGSRDTVESPSSQICGAQSRKTLQVSSSPSKRLDKATNKSIPPPYVLI